MVRVHFEWRFTGISTENLIDFAHFGAVWAALMRIWGELIQGCFELGQEERGDKLGFGWIAFDCADEIGEGRVAILGSFWA
jgi:hypothetical protein